MLRLGKYLVHIFDPISNLLNSLGFCLGSESEIGDLEIDRADASV